MKARRFDLKIYGSRTPAELVKAHALDAGPPFLPPKWMYGTWRWRDEHHPTQSILRRHTRHRAVQFRVHGGRLVDESLRHPAFGIYWVDRPWGPGRMGYDDFEIDTNRLPNFAASVKWLNEQNVQMFLWIAPFFQGQMATNAIAPKVDLAPGPESERGAIIRCAISPIPRPKSTGRTVWPNCSKLGVAGFKLDRSEENIPESGPGKVFDGRSVRENRNAYPAMYVQAAYDVCKEYREDFVCMPRAAYTGSSRDGVFWGGDIGGTPEGLRASIIAVQRAAVMGYPNWGSDTCGYNAQQPWTRNFAHAGLDSVVSRPSWKSGRLTIAPSGIFTVRRGTTRS